MWIMTELSRSFGFQTVEEHERERLIRRVFQSVAPRYDLMNDAMSFGIHRLWKRTFAKRAQPQAGQVIVDLAGGTGDIAALLAAPDRSVIICDTSMAMMRHGRARGLHHVKWLAGAGEALPFADNSVDTLTIAFGIRNVTSLERALAEIHRALKPGGRFLCLEFSRPWAPVRPFYNLFSFTVIPRLGAWIAGEPEAYTYLVESIRRFPHQREMVKLIENAGFRDVRYQNLTFGVACIHSATK